MPFLKQEVIHEIHSAAVSIGLAESRAGLLAGLNSALVGTLRLARTPGEQLLCDICALNDIERLTDGTIPIVQWLRNALVLIGPREESNTFMRALHICDAPAYSDGKRSDAFATEMDLSAGGLRVSDVQVVLNRKHRTCTLDFRVWNNSHADVLINRVLLEVLEVRHFGHLGYFELSHVYDLDISSLKTDGDIASCNVAQLVQPKAVDRFGINLAATQLGPGSFRWWKLQPSLMTNLGSASAPVVELSLPTESEAEYLHREAEQAARQAWKNAIPNCVARYWHAMQERKVDLKPIRDVLETAYPDPAARGLVLFAWLGASDSASWSYPPSYETVPENLLMELSSSLLITALLRCEPAPAQIRGAARHFSSQHVSARDVPDELKQLFLSHSLTPDCNPGKVFRIKRAFGTLSQKEFMLAYDYFYNQGMR